MNTWAKDLNPTYQPLSDIRTKLFATAMLEEMMKTEVEDPEVNSQFLIRILDKRLEVLNLPITFTPAAKLAVLALTDRPGAVTALLVDCLNACELKEDIQVKDEKKVVTPSVLADIYPSGFYDEPTMMKYIDDYLKPRKLKWAEVY